MSGAPGTAEARATAAPATVASASLAVRRLSRETWQRLAAAGESAGGSAGDSRSLLGAIGYGGPAGAAPLLLHVDAPLLGDGGPQIDAWSCIDAPGALSRGRCGSVDWRGDGRWLVGSAAVDNDDGSDVDGGGPGTEALAERLYGDVFATLGAGGCRHLLRVWHYLPSINADEHGLERYRRFNVGRQRAFAAADRTQPGHAPAACALGTRRGPLRLAFLAGRDAPLAVENPRQVSAYRYPAVYGPTSPTFSRAALADAGGGRVALFVSGTASIVGHESRHAGDVEAQAREALANVGAVVAAAQRRTSAGFDPAALSLVVYVRHAGDAGRVCAVIDATLGAASTAARTAVYLQADICRAELLVEIEAHAVAPGKLHADLHADGMAPV